MVLGDTGAATRSRPRPIRVLRYQEAVAADCLRARLRGQQCSGLRRLCRGEQGVGRAPDHRGHCSLYLVGPVYLVEDGRLEVFHPGEEEVGEDEGVGLRLEAVPRRQTEVELHAEALQGCNSIDI